MNEDMKTLTEKIEKMFQEHGYTTQMKRDTTDPHSRWADIFDELWVWKDEDVYYLQFGRIDGSCIFLGGFAMVQYKSEERIYRVHGGVSSVDSVWKDGIEKFFESCLEKFSYTKEELNMGDPRWKPASPDQVGVALFIY